MITNAYFFIKSSPIGTATNVSSVDLIDFYGDGSNTRKKMIMKKATDNVAAVAFFGARRKIGSSFFPDDRNLLSFVQSVSEMCVGCTVGAE